MKILFIRKTTLGAPGAAVTYYFPKLLKLLGHEVAIIAKAGGNVHDLPENGVEIFLIQKNQNWLQQVKSISAQFAPDVVHVFIHAGCVVYPFLLVAEKRPKFLLDIRSPLLKTGVLKWAIRIKNYLEPIGYDVITSHGVESAWTVLGKMHAISWLPPGVDLSKIKTKQSRSTGDVIKLLYIGSLDEKRKLNKMVTAVELASRNCRLTLDIYGGGSGEKDLKRLIVESKMTNTIHLRGTIQREELFQLIPDYDIGLVFIPHGIYETAPPLKAVEYLAANLPVLATNTLGNRVFVKHGVNGALVEEGAEEFSRGILEIIKMLHSGCFGDVSKDARRYSWDEIVSSYLVPIYMKLQGDWDETQ